jgi:hypothetical protein
VSDDRWANLDSYGWDRVFEAYPDPDPSAHCWHDAGDTLHGEGKDLHWPEACCRCKARRLGHLTYPDRLATVTHEPDVGPCKGEP